MAAAAAIDGKAAMIVDGVPSLTVAGSSATAMQPGAATDFRGVVEATSNQWEFRHGVGTESLATAAAMDGKAAMIVPPMPSLPALGSGTMAAPARAAAGVEGMVAAGRAQPMVPSWEFRHGTGGETLAMTAAIDGKAAMLVPSMPSPPALASGDTAAQPMAPPGSVAIGGTAFATSAVNGANTVWDFRHGTGGEGLGFSNDFRHGTPSARARRDA